MSNIALVSTTNIINQIFRLVSKKLALELTIYDSIETINPSDILILDSQFNTDSVATFKTICKKLVLLSTTDEIDINFDAQIKKPFLPSQLQQFLEKITKEDIPKVDTTSADITNNDELEDLVAFVDAIPDDTITQDSEDEYCGVLPNTEDIVINKEDLGSGGVLDTTELSKLHELINDEVNKIDDNEVHLSDDDFVELSDLIDKAIDDINDYDFEENKPITLILNRYSMEELSPLFKKLNQNIIDNLVDGKEISLQLKLEK